MQLTKDSPDSLLRTLLWKHLPYESIWMYRISSAMYWLRGDLGSQLEIIIMIGALAVCG